MPTRIDLGAVGLGGAQLGNLYRAMTDETARQIVDAAWDAGIRSFDTAPHYGLGLSERRLGSLLRDRDRDAVVVSTKVGRRLVPDPEGGARMDDAVASVVVGADDPRQLLDTLARFDRDVPDALWSDLAAVGLLSAEGLRSGPGPT